ncbi:hypothetical protein DFP72DRAFT_946574 [Ephemerocybe angulata]|uniref:RecQ mediated genome instability protein 1 OB-fold domain-containing protein n=1 Tax=Ephemerocybe angulata TaxID=980116 RepID=A0A8H6H7V8_9AGAR|nr:hypothetical protein DFP72DRAFT_946574 [Tulosesus angulatus]
MDSVTVSMEVVAWVNRNFPKPRVDRETSLKSHLSESLDPTDGLPKDIGHDNTNITLSGVPTLVEITSISEVGSSAFQLDQVRKAREDRIQAGGFDEYDEGDEDADLEVEGEGPLPNYPSLVQTPLGFKLQLKAVRIVCGVANLEPDNVILLGGKSDLNQHRDYYLRQNLRERMGLPKEPTPEFEDVEGEIDKNSGAGAPGPPSPPPQAL